jgi:hypothetical protein
MQNRLVVVISVALSLSGCASTITAWKNRPAAAHTLRPDRFFTLTGERRLAFQVDRKNARNLAWCAESLPEAAQAVSATSELSGKALSKFEGAAKDAYSTTLVQTFTRTEIAEIYRQMSFQACQAWAQGVYTDAQYAKRLDDLLASGIKVIETRSVQPLTPLAAAASAAASAGTTKPATTTPATTPAK